MFYCNLNADIFIYYFLIVLNMLHCVSISVICSLYSAFERLFYVWKERYINLVNNNNNNNNNNNFVILETLSIHYVVHFTLIVKLINYNNLPVPGYNKSHCFWWITRLLNNDEITLNQFVLSLVFNLLGSNSLSNIFLTTDGATLCKR